MLTHLGLYGLLTLPLSGPPAGPGLHFVDVGQGAALVLDGGEGELALIDSGPAAGAEALLRALDEHQAWVVDLWVHTHHDADHLGGFAPVVAGFDARLGTGDDVAFARLWDRGLDLPVPDSEPLALYLALAGSRRERPAAGALFESGRLRVEVLDLAPPPAHAPENDRGLALCVDVGGLRALVPGDLSAPLVEIAAEACGPVDLLWLSHHGAADGTSADAITLADPGAIVISAGHANEYCHPSASALALARGRRTWVLDAAGIEPGGRCVPLASALGPEQILVGGDLWFGANGQIWVGGAGGWVRVD